MADISKITIESGTYDIKDAVARNDLSTYKRLGNHKILNIAHRGLCSEAPENSYASIVKASVRGCDGVEIDLQVTNDGYIVVMHDDTVDRTTNGTGIVNQLSASYIGSLNIDTGNYLDAYVTQKVLFLEDVLLLCNEYGLIPMLELKANWTTENLNTLLTVINKHQLHDKVIIISFNLSILTNLRSLDNTIKIDYLLSSTLNLDTVNSMKQYNFGLSLNYNNNSSLSDDIQLALSNVEYGFWTLNDRNACRNLINNNKGMSFIVSDYGYGNYRPRYFKSIAMITETGIAQWQTKFPGNSALYYDMFWIQETYEGSKRYHVNYATPFFHLQDDIYTGAVIMTIENQSKFNYRIYLSSQREDGFDFRIVDSNGNLVSVQEIYTAMGYTYFTITVLF